MIFTFFCSVPKLKTLLWIFLLLQINCCWPKTFARWSLPSSSCELAFANVQQTLDNPLSQGMTWAVLSPSLHHCHINSWTEKTSCRNLVVNSIVTSAFATSWMDLLIHCFLILQNMQLKDASSMNIVARTCIGTTFPLRVLKFPNLLSKIFSM